MSRLLALYPKAWRDRYGAELRSLLIDRPVTSATRFDLLRGAFDAHRHPELVHPAVASPEAAAADVVIARRLGVAGLLGAVAWAVAWALAASGPLVVEPNGSSYRDGAAAFPFLILACGLLVAGLCGQLVILPRPARIARAGAVIAIPGAVLWALVPWNLAFAILVILGLGVLAFGAWFARAWPLAASLALLAMVGAMPVVAAVALGLGPIAAVTAPVLGAFIAMPVIAWLTVGGTLLAQPLTVRA
jgi:hypothetical protein